MNSEINVQKRINWVDISKGYGMLLVILGHITQGEVERWIYSFHVPLFFLMSGFVFSRKENFRVFLKGKCRSLLLPYFSMGAVVILYQSVSGLISDPASFTMMTVWHKVIDLFVQIRCWDLWFLACLFWLEMIFYLIVAIGEMTGEKLKLWTIGILSLLVTWMGFIFYQNGGRGLYWNIDVSIVAVFFFGVGYLFRKTDAERLFQLRFKYIPTRSMIFVIALTVNLTCWMISYQKSGQFLDMYMGSFGIVPLTYLAALGGTVAIIILSHWFFIKPIEYIGKNSLVYYCWHQSIMIPIVQGIMGKFGLFPDSDSGRFENVFCMLLLFVLVVAGMSCVSYFMNRTRLRYMLGHWK